MIALAQRADADQQWDSIWVGDSILAKPRLDALTLMGALAVVTDRVKIGPACFASTPLRDGLLLAYQWASLDFMADGRTIFAACMGQPAAGGGDMLHEFDAFCVAPNSRMRRMEEAIEAMNQAREASGIYVPPGRGPEGRGRRGKSKGGKTGRAESTR